MKYVWLYYQCEYISVITLYVPLSFLKYLIQFQTGSSSLSYAAQGGFLSIVKLLLKYGADIDVCGMVSKLTLFAELSHFFLVLKKSKLSIV